MCTHTDVKLFVLCILYICSKMSCSNVSDFLCLKCDIMRHLKQPRSQVMNRVDVIMNMFWPGNPVNKCVAPVWTQICFNNIWSVSETFTESVPASWLRHLINSLYLNYILKFNINILQCWTHNKKMFFVWPYRFIWAPNILLKECYTSFCLYSLSFIFLFKSSV